MSQQIIETLLSGGLVVLRTDTVYGILAIASNQVAVERIYALKGRQSHKPFIQLISDSSQIFGDAATFVQHEPKYRDRPTSIVIESEDAPDYLLRSGSSLAYRLERSGKLHEILEQTGPLVAPSANPEGQPTAQNIEQAKAYFGDTIDLYVDDGEVPKRVEPSRIVKPKPDGSVEILR